MHCLYNPKNRPDFELCLSFSVGLRLLEHLGRGRRALEVARFWSTAGIGEV